MGSDGKYAILGFIDCVNAIFLQAAELQNFDLFFCHEKEVFVVQ